MAFVPVGKQLPPRMSFAQVAAAANNPKAQKMKPGVTILQEETLARLEESQGPSLIVPIADPTLNAPELYNAQSIEKEFDYELNIGNAKVVTDPTSLSGILKATTLDDGTLQLSSSDSMKKDNSDTKSITSRVTFTMEEKESLRPDDSASMQAGLDEDAFSVPGSLVANSRVPSDPDARAFDDQLREINQTGLAGQFAPRTPAIFNPSPQNGAIIYTSPQEPGSQKISVSAGLKLRGLPDGAVIPPDEKLLDALRSPRDRVFVLKIEQDIIDFVKDPKEQQLHLPQTNSFYRMLTHKLADYYLLEHAVDETMTSVRLFRTENCRLPPPLIDINGSAVNTDTPPPNAPARKIMRRGVLPKNSKPSSSGNGTVNSSQNPSKSPSETGTGSGSEDGNKSKDKATLSREERENRYKEARARIFKDFKEDEAQISDGIADANEVSRASSVSASKKTSRQQKMQDDGFEARSAYTQYLPQSIPSPSFNGHLQEHHNFESYPTFAAHGQYSAISSPFPHVQSPPNAGNNQGVVPGNPSQFGWNYPSFTAHYSGVQNGVNSEPHTQGAYVSPTSFQTNLQSFSSPNSASQATPKLMPLHPNTYGANFHPYPLPQDQSSWPHVGHQGSFTHPGYGFANSRNPTLGSNNFHFQPAPINGFVQQSQHDHSYQQQLSLNLQRQFNPLSQSFVPGTQGRPHQAFANGFNHYNGYTGRFVSPGQSPMLSGSQSTSLLPQFPQASPNGQHVLPLTPTRPSNQSSRGGKPPQSSISKWGNTSTLPPKPPPPAPSFQSPLIKDNQLPLPPHPVQSLARQQSHESPRTMNTI